MDRSSLRSNDPMIWGCLRGSFVAAQVSDLYGYLLRLIWSGGLDLIEVLALLQKSLHGLSNQFNFLIFFSRKSNRSIEKIWNQIKSNFFLTVFFSREKSRSKEENKRSDLLFFLLVQPLDYIDLSLGRGEPSILWIRKNKSD